MMTIMVFGLILIFGALALYVYFGLLWLKTGAWPASTAIDGICWAISCAPESWAYWPQDWLGIHKALMWLSPPGAMFLLGMAMAWLAVSVSEN